MLKKLLGYTAIHCISETCDYNITILKIESSFCEFFFIIKKNNNQ